MTTEKPREEVLAVLSFSTYLQIQTDDNELREWIKGFTKRYLYGDSVLLGEPVETALKQKYLEWELFLRKKNISAKDREEILRKMFNA